MGFAWKSKPLVFCELLTQCRCVLGRGFRKLACGFCGDIKILGNLWTSESGSLCTNKWLSEIRFWVKSSQSTPSVDSQANPQYNVQKPFVSTQRSWLRSPQNTLSCDFYTKPTIELPEAILSTQKFTEYPEI